MNGGDQSETTSLRSPRLFGIMVVAVLIITFLSFVATLLAPLLVAEPPTALESRTLIACDFGFKSGFGALVGLFGGKVTS
jgi:hypothetical protein